MKKVSIIVLLLALICVFIGILFYFLPSDRDSGGEVEPTPTIVPSMDPSPTPTDDVSQSTLTELYHAYLCTRGPKTYTSIVNTTEVEVTYEQVEEYSFIESEQEITNPNYKNTFHFQEKEDYLAFLDGKTNLGSFKEELDEENLTVTYTGFYIFPNQSAEKSDIFTTQYLKQLEDDGFKCTLEEK